jgi:hypothetical protein
LNSGVNIFNCQSVCEKVKKVVDTAEMNSSLTLEMPSNLLNCTWPADMASQMCPSGADGRRDRCVAIRWVRWH